MKHGRPKDDALSHVRCVDPPLGELRLPYAFGDLEDSWVPAFEVHLLACHACWQEVEALRPAVRVLRTDSRLLSTATSTAIAGLMGLSAALYRPQAGHLPHVVVCAVLYGAMFAVPVLVEVAYQWGAHGGLAVRVAPIVLLAMTLFTLLASRQAVSAARRGHYGAGPSLTWLIGGAVAVAASVAVVLPATPTVTAAFTTYPAHLGYLKSVFYAHLVGPPFLVWPLTFVTAMQGELQRGRHQQVLWLIDGDARAVPPRGVHRLTVRGLLVYLGLLCVFHLAGMSHLFDNLVEGRYRTLFMALVMLRIGVSLMLPCVSLWWYATSLDDLRRECVAVLSFYRPGRLGTSRTAAPLP
jgi:hypothetical protein